MFEGHDTTAAAMCWALHLIGSHPDVQNKLHEELDRVLGDADTPTFEQLKAHELPYLEQVLKECLRLYPSVPAIGRELDHDLNVCGYEVPKTATVLLLSFLVHRDPKYWPDPHTFDPERFSPENSAHRHPYCYVPFSAGPRNCIGKCGEFYCFSFFILFFVFFHSFVCEYLFIFILSIYPLTIPLLYSIRIFILLLILF